MARLSRGQVQFNSINLIHIKDLKGPIKSFKGMNY